MGGLAWWLTATRAAKQASPNRPLHQTLPSILSPSTASAQTTALAVRRPIYKVNAVIAGEARGLLSLVRLELRLVIEYFTQSGTFYAPSKRYLPASVPGGRKQVSEDA